MHHLALLLLLLPQPAHARPGPGQEPKKVRAAVYDTISVEQLEALLFKSGIAFETSRREGEDTFLRLLMGDVKAVLVLSDRGTGVADDFTLFAGFQVHTTPTPMVINEWNLTRRFCRAYVDTDGDPVLESDLDLAGGVLADHILQHLALFDRNVRDFVTHLGFQ